MLLLKRAKKDQKLASRLEKNKETSVNVTFPSELHIELVQANEIKNYEIFQWLATATVSIGLSFWISFFLSNLPFNNLGQKGLLVSAIIFTIFSIIFIVLAIRRRRRAFSKTVEKTLNLDEFRRNSFNK